jgi:hypothetical protein
MADQNESIWLKVFCPGEACLREEEHINLPESGQLSRASSWLEIFCPQSSCEVTTPSQLP